MVSQRYAVLPGPYGSQASAIVFASAIWFQPTVELPLGMENCVERVCLIHSFVLQHLSACCPSSGPYAKTGGPRCFQSQIIQQ
jgi:hypothetical protein